MKKVLIVGACPGSDDAISSIFECFLSVNLGNNDVSFFCFGPEHYRHVTNGPHLVMEKDPLRGEVNITRAKRKILRKLNLDDSLIEARLCLKMLIKNFSKEKWDLIIGVAGNFSYIEAAMMFSKKFNAEFRFMTFDPYSQSPFITFSRQKRVLKETEWVKNSTFYYVDHDGGGGLNVSAQNLNKERTFLIPFRRYENSASDRRAKNIVYGGLFYKNVREPYSIISLASKPAMSGFTFEVYSNWKGTDSANLHFHNLLSKKEFTEKLRTALAIAVVGNKKLSENYKSSKYLEAVSYKKPIICFDMDISDSCELKNYPLLFTSSDPKLAEKLFAIRGGDYFGNVCLDDIFPNRKPENFVKTLLE